jgi:hypothetical protein
MVEDHKRHEGIHDDKDAEIKVGSIMYSGQEGKDRKVNNKKKSAFA